MNGAEKLIRVLIVDDHPLLLEGIAAFSSLGPRRPRSCAVAVCFLQLASALSAAEPALVRLAVSEGKDIRFTHLTTKDGLSPGQIRDILQEGVFVVQHLVLSEPV